MFACGALLERAPCRRYEPGRAEERTEDGSWEGRPRSMPHTLFKHHSLAEMFELMCTGGIFSLGLVAGY